MKHIESILMLTLLLTACNSQASFDERCRKEAKQQTLQLCPRKIIDGLTLDSVTYTPVGRRFSYCHTLDDSLYATDRIKEVHEKLRTDILNNIRKSVELKKYKEKKVVFQYTYIGKYSKHPVLRFTFEPKEYSK